MTDTLLRQLTLTQLTIALNPNPNPDNEPFVTEHKRTANDVFTDVSDFLCAERR